MKWQNVMMIVKGGSSMGFNFVVSFLMVCSIISSSCAGIPMADRWGGSSLEGGPSATIGICPCSIPPDFVGSPTFTSGFVENRGQLEDDAIRYYAPLGLGGIAFVDSGVMINVEEPPRAATQDVFTRDGLMDDVEGHRYISDDARDGYRKGCTVRLDFDGASMVRPVGRCRLPGGSNFFLGNDPSRWRTGVPSYSEVSYEGLYDGIDLVYRMDNRGVKYEFIVAPGASPDCIRFHIRGHEGLAIEQGDLVILTPVGRIADAGLQVVFRDSPKEWVECSFELRGKDAYGFNVSRYDGDRTLVIDPLIYSTYLGGSGWDQGFSMRLDSSGCIYLGGSTDSNNFPTTLGAYQIKKEGFSDAFLCKLSPDGTKLVYSTFIGGGGSDECHDIFVDSQESLYAGGWTASQDFPTTPGALQTQIGGIIGGDGFICKLNAKGNSLNYSTYIGSENLDWVSALTVDESGCASSTGFTRSLNFNTTERAFQTSFGGGPEDAFVCKLNPSGSAFEYSTFLGGELGDGGNGIALDPSGYVYICGYTQSVHFPVTVDAYQTSRKGYLDVFVTKLTPDGNSSIYSTYIGGTAHQAAYDLALDRNDSAHIVGLTYSNDYPTTDEAFQPFFGGGDYDSFITKLDANGSSVSQSTLFGGGDRDSINSIAIDEVGNVVVCGTTRSANLCTTDGADQTVPQGNDDAFIVRMDADFSKMDYCTYLGGKSSDYGNHILSVDRWSVYVAGKTCSDDFPTTSEAYQTSLVGGNSATFFCEMSFDLESPIADAGLDQAIDQHQTITLNGTGSRDNVGIVNWTWTLLYDGYVVRLYNVTSNFTFHTAGSYSVTLTVRDEARHKATDEVEVIVRDITPPVADAGINWIIQQHDTVDFDGRQSTDNVAIANWTWNFTYGNEEVLLYGSTQNFTFDEAGEYIVMLNVSDGAGNWATDFAIVHVRDISVPRADAGADIIIDQHETAFFNGTGSHDNIGVVNWTWCFVYGDELVTLYGPSPSFTFDGPGCYTVLLIVRDEVNNEAMDTVMVEVRDITDPVADAGPDQVIDQHQQVFFDGAGSSDNIGIAIWSWIFEYNGTSITLNGRQPDFIFDVPGVFVVILRITDEDGNWATDEMRVTVRDIADPVAVAGGDICIDQHEDAFLDGSSSTDNVEIVEWVWTFEYEDEVVRLPGMTTTYYFHNAGVYNVSLMVRDDAGNNGTDEVTVTVRDVTAPVANPGGNQTVDQHVTVTLDGSSSSDNVGLYAWEWTFEYDEDRVNLSGRVQTFYFDLVGEYDVTLTVTDLAGNSASGIMTVTVRDITVPIPAHKRDITARVGDRVEFDGSASADNVGVVKWVWTFEECGRTVELEGEVVDYTFEWTGDYEVTLTVYDAEGNSANEEFMVTVNGTDSIWWNPIIIIVIILMALYMIKYRRDRNR